MHQRHWFLQLSDRATKPGLKEVAHGEAVVPRNWSYSGTTHTDWCWTPDTLPCWFSVKELFLKNIWTFLLVGKVTSEGKVVKVTIFKSLFGHKGMDFWWGKIKYHKSRKAFRFLQLSGNWLWKWQKSTNYQLAFLLLLSQEAYQDNVQTNT